MRHEPIYDPEGDRIEAQERRDREMEKQSHPQTWLGPLERCEDCGLFPRELIPGFFVCSCGLPVIHL